MHNRGMEVHRSQQFARWVDEVSRKYREGDPYAIKVTKYALDQLRFLRSLDGEPEEESQRFKRVRQSKRYPLWRLSHAHDADVALRIICWFDDESDTVVVALFANDKAPMGDVFYDSVGSRADQVIDEWKRQNPRSRR